MHPGKGEDLPFQDGEFNVVYCSFLLLWVKDPGAVMDEMLRVSKDFVVCLAEPDYAGRVDYPPELSELTSMIVEGTRNAGGDPCMGRKLRSLFSERGMDAEIGIHPGAWSLERLRAESEAEWEWAEGMVGDAGWRAMERLRVIWDALTRGTLFQHNPIFSRPSGSRRITPTCCRGRRSPCSRQRHPAARPEPHSRQSSQVLVRISLHN
jgi:SAM-dependent methyltransferase